MIVIKDVNKSFGAKQAVKDLNVTFNDASITALIGPNGAGKTTSIKMMTGILPLDSGEITINGYNIAEDSRAKKEFTLVFDTPDNFLFLSGREYIEFLAEVYQIDRSDFESKLNQLLLEFGIENDFDKLIASYSHGMRQKTMVIGALMINPKVWILDEPLTGLDPISSFKLKEKMREHAAKGNIVIFSTHVLEVAEKLCDRVVIINHGQAIYQGSIEDLKQLYPGIDLENIFFKLIGENYGQE